MPDLRPTDEQAAIISATASPKALLIEAYAGTAKTTTLQLAAPKRREPAIALAFNKSIAEELRPRLPQNWQVKTLNGLGHLAWARALPAETRLQLDDRKLGKLVTLAAKESRASLSRDLWDTCRQLVSAAMQAGLAPAGEEGAAPLLPDSPESWHSLALDCDVSASDEALLVELARDVLRRSIALAKTGVVSFDDQIYCPTILSPDRGWLKFPVLAVDEAQDLSQLNHRMISLATRRDAKLIVVGDFRQAIYAFRGADSESIASLRGLRHSWDEQRLTLTFRCPRTIVARQQAHAPGYRAAPSVREGSFHHLCEAEQLESWSWEDFLAASPEASSRAILCRNNAPLLKLAFMLIRRRIGPHFAGRDLGKGLLALLRKIAPDEATPAGVLRGKIEEWEVTERSRLLGEDRADKLASIEDRAQSLLAVLDGCEARDRGDLERGIEQIFRGATGTPMVVLSSIHRAKGLEWDAVLHLDPWRVPSRQAKRAAAAGNFAPLKQERNLKYVCETRTRDVLVEANVEDFQ